MPVFDKRRTDVLRTGMGFFAFAAGATLINGLLLPFAGQRYGYPRALVLLSFALAACILPLAGRRLLRARRMPSERGMRWAVRGFLLIVWIAQVALGYWMEYTPSGDNFMLYNGAQALARDGNFSSNPDFGLYLARFSNQWGVVLIFTGVMKLLMGLGVTQMFMPLVVLLALLQACGFASLLGMARRFRGARGQAMMMILLSACLPMWLAASVLYTDTYSMPFVILALDCALRVLEGKRPGIWALGCGAMALLGCQIKMTAAIVFIAAAIVWLTALGVRRAAPYAALCAALLLGGQACVHRAMLGGAIDPDVYAQQNTPTIHWIMMTIPTSDNPYGLNSGDYGVTWGMMDEGATHDEVMDSIYTRMKDRIYTLRYPNRLAAAALRKNASALCDGTYGMTEMLDDRPVRENMVSSFVLEGRPYYALYGALCTGVHMALWLFALLSCVRDIRRRDVSLSTAYIAMFGVMLFLMIWEARSRYLLNFVPVLLLLACAYLVPRTETVQ